MFIDSVHLRNYIETAVVRISKNRKPSKDLNSLKISLGLRIKGKRLAGAFVLVVHWFAGRRAFGRHEILFDEYELFCRLI